MNSYTNTVTETPGELMRQVSAHMIEAYNDVLVTVPVITTWRDIMDATESALEGQDAEIIVTKKRTQAQRQRLRQAALDSAANWEASSLGDVLPGRLIRTYYDADSLPQPKPASKEVSTWLKENMIPFEDAQDPYPVVLTATITERTLPMVKANVVLKGVDAEDSTVQQSLTDMMLLWDTGAQATTITDDLISEQFSEYLKTLANNPYRSGDKTRVQIELIIALSNIPIRITVFGFVIPKACLPNQTSCILLGQQQCINRMSYRSVPRSILEAKGEVVGEEVWGDIIIDELINDDWDLVSV